MRIAEQLGEYAGLGRGPSWVSQPGWISDVESKVDRIASFASFAIDPHDCEGVLWEAFREMEQQTEQQRFRLFVHGCARDWMAVVEEAAGVAQEEEDKGASQAGDDQESDAGDWTVVRADNLDSRVTLPMLQATFAQIGCVQWAEMAQDEGAGWGWVGSERSEDAEEAV